jgi:hypothetical protein
VAAHRDLVLLRLPHLQQDYFICRLQSVLLAAAQTDPHVYGTSIGTCEEEREGVAEPVLDLLVHNKWDVMQNLQIHYREEELLDLLYWKTDIYSDPPSATSCAGSITTEEEFASAMCSKKCPS